MTLAEWIHLCPPHVGALVFTELGQYTLLPKADPTPEYAAQPLLMCAALLASGNEDLQELVMQRHGIPYNAN